MKKIIASILISLVASVSFAGQSYHQHVSPIRHEIVKPSHGHHVKYYKHKKHHAHKYHKHHRNHIKPMPHYHR